MISGAPEVEQPLQPVVPVDDPAVEVVEVGGGEAAAVELHHRAQLGRDDRDGVEDHGPRVVDPPAVLVAAVEGGDDLQPLDGLLAALGRQRAAAVGGVDHLAELDLLLVEVDPVDEPGDGLGAHAALEVVAVADPQLAPQQLVLDDLAGVQVAELVEGPLGQVDLGSGPLADGGDLLLDRALAGLDLGVLAPRPSPARASSSSSALNRRSMSRSPLLLDLGDLLGQLGLEVGQVLVALLLVDPGDQVGGEVDDLLQLLGLQLLTGLGAHEQVGQPAAGAPQVPDVHDRGGQLDVAHALAADLGAGDLDAAALADDAAEPDPLVLAAVALPVLGRTEDLLAEEPVLLRAQRAVVDGLGLLDLAVGPAADGVGRGQADPQLVEVVDVQHRESPLGGAPRVFLVRPALGPADVDAQLLGRAEHVLVELAHLDLLAPVARHLDVEAEGLHLLDEHLEALGDARLGDVLALHDRLVDLHPAEHVVGLDGEQLLQGVGGAVGLEGPHLHLPEALATELGLPAEGLLGDHRVRAGRAGVDLVVDQVGQLQDVHVADRDRVVVGLAGPAVVEDRLAVGRPICTVAVGRRPG